MPNPTLRDLASLIVTQVPENRRETYRTAQIMPGLIVLQSDRTTALDATLYEPVVCLIVQGQKEVRLGNRHATVGAGQSLVVSHDLPVVSRITRADAEQPYLAMVVVIDVLLLRSLYEEIADVAPPTTTADSLTVFETEPALLDCLSRYLRVARDPVEARVMAPLLRKELHFRLLMAPQGGMLRQLLRHDSHASAIARAITKIRRNFRSALKVPSLAREVGMSASSFYKHFKDVTSTTPLQYQKELRLLEARRLLSSGTGSVTDVAFEVGYESPNQFSREYSRKFGTSPRDHMAASAP
jgi:AraC-like DNA-binding protein